MQQKVKKLTVLRLKAQAQKGIDVYKQKYTQAREELETAMLLLRKEMETPALKFLERIRQRPRSPPHFEKFPK